ncbi:MAG: hypothetical protein U5J97_05165 [Trueperaceae bacterium]|nr:hypothetical protein [Trueperaceae bacterium]
MSSARQYGSWGVYGIGRSAMGMPARASRKPKSAGRFDRESAVVTFVQSTTTPAMTTAANTI